MFTLTLIGGTYSYSQLGCLDYPEDFAVPSGTFSLILKFYPRFLHNSENSRNSFNFIVTEKCGPDNDKTLITVSYFTGLTEKTLFATCLDEDTSNSISSHNLLYSVVGERETGSDGMPDFTPDDFYPSFDVDNAYSKVEIF